jgi:hypothetical protein
MHMALRLKPLVPPCRMQHRVVHLFAVDRSDRRSREARAFVARIEITASAFERV